MNANELVADAIAVAPPVLQAAAIGALVTLHPLRFRRLRRDRKGRDLLAAQVLVTIAGALLVVIIGDDSSSAARAFGLLGLGSFIRFRTAVKSPSDTAVFFLLIGLGMACGIGRLGAASFGALLLMVALGILEWWRPPEPDEKT